MLKMLRIPSYCNFGQNVSLPSVDRKFLLVTFKIIAMITAKQSIRREYVCYTCCSKIEFQIFVPYVEAI